MQCIVTGLTDLLLLQWVVRKFQLSLYVWLSVWEMWEPYFVKSCQILFPVSTSHAKLARAVLWKVSILTTYTCCSVRNVMDTHVAPVCCGAKVACYCFLTTWRWKWHFTVCAMKAYRSSRGIAPHILNLSARCRCLVSIILQPLPSPEEKTQVPVE